MDTNMGVSAGELAKLLGTTLKGDESVMVGGIAALDVAGESDLSFVAQERYVEFVSTTKARCLIIQKGADLRIPEGKTLLEVDNVEEAVEKVAEVLYPPKVEYPMGFISPYASIAPNSVIGADCYIGPFCVIEENAVVEDGVVCVAQVYVGSKAFVGEGSFLFPGVYIGERCRLGKRVVVHSNSVIGCDGFGYRQRKCGDVVEHSKLRHFGIVEIEDDVEIGSCVCIDRARFDKTRIGAGTKIDNLVHIAHNVQVGKRNLLVAQVGIAGSARLGDDVIAAGQAGIDGHIKVGNKVRVAGKAGVTKAIPDGMTVAGYPAQEHIKEKRVRAAIRALPELMKRIKTIERTIGREYGNSTKDNEDSC